MQTYRSYSSIEITNSPRWFRRQIRSWRDGILRLPEGKVKMRFQLISWHQQKLLKRLINLEDSQRPASNSKTIFLLCEVRNTADIRKTSPLLRMFHSALTGIVLPGTNYLTQNRRISLISFHVGDNIRFGISMAVANHFFRTNCSFCVMKIFCFHLCVPVIIPGYYITSYSFICTFSIHFWAS
jgi:hypothetical protein